MAEITFSEHAGIDLDELQHLFGRAWGGDGKTNYERVLERAFTWIIARHHDRLVGFANVAWDGGSHLFLLDTTVDPDYQQRGIGTRLVRTAIAACQGHGEWIQVIIADAAFDPAASPTEAAESRRPRRDHTKRSPRPHPAQTRSPGPS
jgi:GNAT superfamily N-acetyltransferase